MTDFCYVCGRKDQEIAQFRGENSSLRSTLSLVKRAINGTRVETLDELGTLNLDQATRLMVLEALDRAQGNRTIAAELLGIARSTLFLYLQRYEIRDASSRPLRRRRVEVVETA
jgi:DNA-binding protein Fis